MIVTRELASYHANMNGEVVTLPAGQFRYCVVFYAEGYDLRAAFTSVSLGGSAMTKIEEAIGSTGVQIWGLVIPNDWTGNKTFATVGSGRGSYMIFSGVDPVSPVLDSSSQYSNDSSGDFSSITVTAKNIGAVYDILSVWDSAGTAEMTVSANQTELVAGERDGEYSLSYYTSPPSGDAVMRWDWTDLRFAHAVISLNNYSGGQSIRWFF